MKKNILFSISFVIAAFVFCLMFSTSVEAAGEVNISSCNMNISAGHTIIGTSGTYWVNQSIFANESGAARACIIINSSDVVLDCRGNDVITGQIIGITNLTGIWTNETNVTIQNCFLSNFSDAINLSSSTNVIIWNNTLENMTNIAINVVNSNTSNFSTNIINNCTVAGINMTSSFTNTIELNTFFTTGTTINIETGENNSILSNTLNTGTEGIDLWNEITATILSNTIGNYSNIGIQSLNSNGTSITSNTIKNTTTIGIFLNFSFANTVTSNTVYNATTAIYSDRSDDGSFTSNTVLNGTTGIYLVRNNNMTLTSNTARKFNMGQRFRNASNTTITLATANNNNFGFYIDTDSDGNTFTNTVANANANYGLLIIDTLSGNNTFTEFNLSNPSATARDLNINAGDNKFYTIAVRYSNASETLRTVFSFKSYNGTKMNISAVEDVLVPGDPITSPRRNISKYLNITRPAGFGVTMNFSYTTADITNLDAANSYIPTNSLKVRHYNGSQWLVLTSFVSATEFFVSANLTAFSEFGLFGEVTTPIRKTGGSSSGGAGGISALNLDVDSEVTRNIRKLYPLSFIRKFDLHKLTILNIDTITKEVTIKLESTPKVLTIKENATVEVDIDDNGYYDLSITVDQFTSNTALLTLKRVTEKRSVAQRPIVKDQEFIPEKELLEKKAVPEREDFYQAIEKPKEKTNVFWIFLIVIAVIIAGWIILETSKKKKRR